MTSHSSLLPTVSGNNEHSVLEFLARHDISFERFEHAPLHTMDDARAVVGVRGAMTKNLFLRSKGPEKLWLVVTPHNARVDLLKLQIMLGVRKLSFGKADEMFDRLGVHPGSVTLLALLNDPDKHVTPVIDSYLWSARETQHHPLVNTSTVVLSQEGLRKLLKVTGHVPSVVAIPTRGEGLAK